MKKKEPIVGIDRVTLTKKEGTKVKAFVDVVIPSPFKGITIRNFKVVEGKKGLFVSLPSRPANVNGQTKYYNDIRFENQECFKEFIEELNRTILPVVEDRLKKAKETVKA